LEHALEVAHAVEPHIISLVEVDEPWGMPATLAELGERSGYTWIFSPTFEFGSETTAGGFGNALLARIPIIACHHWHLVCPEKPYDGTEESEPRSVTLAKLRFGSAQFWMGITHLPRNNAEARMTALHQLSMLSRQLHAPWIICGDFNTPPSYLPADIGSNIAPDPAQPTYPSIRPTDPIDYCIFSSEITAEARVLPVSGSDHLALLISPRFPG
jgi:endonuclease/exonuclease/phosphatase family metal-dependent hydrolase